jgi:hypothetical protein
MSDHIHVGYRGGAFDANFDSIFRRPTDSPAANCGNCQHFLKPCWCAKYGEDTFCGNYCNNHNYKTRSV